MRKVLLVLSLFLMLSGCRSAASTQPTSSVVAQISAEGTFEGRVIQCQYSDSERIRSILLHIRALRPRHSVLAETEGETVRIVLTYRDGHRKQYQLKAASCWQENDQGWKSVNTLAAEKLCRLLLDLQAEDRAS